MRLGCGGCLSTLLGLILAGLLIGGSVFGIVRSLQVPVVTRVPGAPDEGARAQQKFFSVLQPSRRAEIVTFTEVEVQELLRKVDIRDLALRDPAIRLPDRQTVDLTGHLPLGKLLAESPLASASQLLPAVWLARPVWVRVTAEAWMETEPRRQLRLDPTRLIIGRQAWPPVMLRLLLDPATLGLLRLRLPSTIESVEIERGRVVVRTAGRA